MPVDALIASDVAHDPDGDLPDAPFDARSDAIHDAAADAAADSAEHHDGDLHPHDGPESDLPLIGDAGCDQGTIEMIPSTDNSHVATGTPVVYDHEPPCIGQHWAQAGVAPAANGESMTPLEPERYVHNLEHGAVAFLYDCPTGCTALVDALRDYATMRPPDDGGAFRWVLTPRSGMPTTVSVVTWGWIQRLDTADIPKIDCFVHTHYRKAPEDIPTP
jgi:hypothetical protein